MWLVRKYTGICSQTSLQPVGDGSVRYWASSLQVILIQERPDCLKHSDIQWLQQGDVASEAYFSYRKYDILATVMTQKPVLLLGSEEFTFMFLNRNGSALSCFSELHSYKTPYLFSTNFFFSACESQHFQQKHRQNYIKSLQELFGLPSSVIFPESSKALMAVQTTGWKLASLGNSALIQNIILFKISFSLVALPLFKESSSEQPLSSVPLIPLPWCCLYSWSNSWSPPSSLQHSCVPAQGLPQASHCVGLCTAARWYSQYMLRVILSASGMNDFIAASLSEKSAWKLSQGAVLGATDSKWKQVTIEQN